MKVTAKTRKRRRKAKDEVQLQAMPGDGIVPDVDRASITMEHFDAASTVVKSFAGTCLANDNCHLRCVMIGTSTVQATHS